MIRLWIIGWAVVVAIAVALAFLLAVGAGFGRRPSPLVSLFITVTLAPGKTVDKTKPVMLLPIAWVTWTLAGAAAIVGLRAVRGWLN